MPTIHYGDLRRISEGSRFSVFRAHRSDGAEVILKQGTATDRLRHEYEILRTLEVPGIAKPLELTQENGQARLVLEDAGSKNLAQRLDGRALPIETFFELALPMVEAVRQVHARRVIHRDICPENFVIDEVPGTVTLVDFESATSVPAFVEMAGVPGDLGTTLAYMAPEQTGRMTRRVDRRADLYSLGAVFYEMLTGQPPFPTDDPLELVHAHAAKAPYTPAIVNPAVPTMVSDIVVKLLTKMPEWRYQTAEALAEDLAEARRRQLASGQAEQNGSFELGRRDLPYGLLLQADALYGREDEQALLARAFDRAADGSTELVLVSGPAGIGKSSLSKGLRHSIRGRARWISGRGDLLRGNVPYAPVAEAMGDLVGVLSAEPEPVREAIRKRVQTATSPNASVLVDALPVLRELLGSPEPAPMVGVVERENRFHFVFVAFLNALLAEGPGLVLFFDDLQWADAASLKLLRAMAVEPQMRSLLLLCGCRSEVLTPEHAVTVMLEAVSIRGGHVTGIELGALDDDDLLALLSDALRAEPFLVGELRDLVRNKTAGNPFFVRQFLGYLYRTQLLALEDGKWTWDLRAIEAAEVTPNVVALLSKVIATLAPEVQISLRAAACIGYRFELGLLAHLLDQSLQATAHALWAPVQQGLLVPATKGPRFRWAGDTLVELGQAPAFRFVHDRIQQAAYEGLPESERKRLHLRIGQWLEKHLTAEVGAGAIVDQLNRAADALPPDERLRLASLNALAGRSARREGAYDSALGYFRTGRGLLGEEPWVGETHALWFALQRDAAECAGLVGDLRESDRLVDEGIGLTSVGIEKAELNAIGVQSSALSGAHAQALDRGVNGLRALGIELPDDVTSEQVLVERKHAQALLRSKSDQKLLEAPTIEDPVQRMMLRILVLLSSGWFIRPKSFQLVACRAAALTAEHGVAPGSGVGLTYYGIALAMSGEYAEAQHYGHLGVQIAERLRLPSEESRALLIHGGHVNPWKAPFADSIPMLERSFELGIESGDLEFAAYALVNITYIRMMAGSELNEVLVEAERTLVFYRKMHLLWGLPYVQPVVQAIRCLLGQTKGPSSFDDEHFDEERFAAATDNGLGQAAFQTLKLQTSYLLGELDHAWLSAKQAMAWLPYWRTIPMQVDVAFYGALTALALSERSDGDERNTFLARARDHLQRLELWAQHSAHNYRHKCLLVEAELARIEDRPADALRLYQAAIEWAADVGRPQDEALAHELCARFQRSRNVDRMAELHVRAAHKAYCKWGASLKAERLEREFPVLGLRSVRKQHTPREPPALDYLSLMKASEALTSVLELEPLLSKLVRTCGEAAEAERTVLALDEGGLVVRATATVRGDVTLGSRRLGLSDAVPVSIVERVFRSGEPLVLGDAAGDGRYAQDPYVAQHKVRSVLAVPIIRGDARLGVLYFENNLASDAFSPDRVEMFRLLSAQMAVALENSRLYEERKRSEAALRLLSETSAQLAETLDYKEVLSKVGGITVPALADWCVLDALEDGTFRPLAWAHVDPALAPKVEILHRRYPIDASSSQPQAQVLRTKRSLLIAEVTDDVVRTGARDEEHRRILHDLLPRSVMVVPLVARGRNVGAVTFVSSSRTYTNQDLDLAEEVVRRIGLALDNARLHGDLQDALRQREERDRYLRMVFRSLPGAVWALDRQLRLTYVTGRVADVSGLDARAAIGRTLYEVLGTEDPTDVSIAHHLGALQGEKQSFESRFRGRWYAVLVDPIRDPEHNVVGCVGVGFDITEKKAIAERLERSERRLQEAQAVAHVGSFEWDIQPNQLTWSDELQRIYGFEPGQFGGTFEAFMERIPPEEIESTQAIIFDAFAKQRPFTYDHRILRVDGAVRMLHSQGDVIKDAQGNPIRMVGTCWDVSDQLELMEKLEHALSRWAATIDATAEGILVTDLDRKVVAVNERFLALWRIRSHAVEGSDHLPLLSGAFGDLEDSEAFIERVQKIYDHPDEDSTDVIRFRDGRIFERHSRPQRIGDAIAGRVWSIRDITERERLLQRAVFLAEATRLLASLDVDQALEGVAQVAVPSLGEWCAIDLFGNGSPRRLVTVSADPKRPLSPEVHPSVLAGNSLLYEIGANAYLGVPILAKGNLVGAITLAAAPHRKYQPSDLELAEELARRTALTIDNARLYRRAQDALLARDDFLSIAAHEIRGPIHAIHMAVQTIRQAKVSPGELPRLFEIIERQDRRLAKFVDELLDLGQIRSGRLQLDYSDVDLREVTRDVVTRFGPELARSGSTLTVTGDPVVGRWDRSRLDQIASNLISNAIKFGRGQPIEVTITEVGGAGVLEVADEGMGIESEFMDRVFKPFERGVSVRHYGGLGLGLHIVSTIVGALGGTVTVTSEPGHGSRFRVELPQKRVEAGRDEDPHRR